VLHEKCGVITFEFFVYKSSSWKSRSMCIAGKPINKLTSSLMTVALLSDRRADVILRPRSAKTMFGRFFVYRKNNYVLRLAVRILMYKICHILTWPTRHDDTSGHERAIPRRSDAYRSVVWCECPQPIPLIRTSHVTLR